MQTIWATLVVVLLCSNTHLLPQASGDRRNLQVSGAHPARLSRRSTNAIGTGGMHGAIADLIDFFGFDQAPVPESLQATDAGHEGPNKQAGTPQCPCTEMDVILGSR